MTYTYDYENNIQDQTRIDEQLLVQMQTLLKILCEICELRTNDPLIDIIRAEKGAGSLSPKGCFLMVENQPVPENSP